MVELQKFSVYNPTIHYTLYTFNFSIKQKAHYDNDNIFIVNNLHKKNNNQKSKAKYGKESNVRKSKGAKYKMKLKYCASSIKLLILFGTL